MEHILDRDALRAALRRRGRQGKAGWVDRGLSLGAAVNDALPYGDGLASAALHGFSADERERGLGFALTTAAGSGGTVAWIAPSHPPSTVAQNGCGLSAARLLLIRAVTSDDLLWAGEEALRSGAVSAVVIEADRWNDEELQRFAIAAGTGGGYGFCLLSSESAPPRCSAFSSQWRIHDGSGARRSVSRFADPWWEVELLGTRGPSRGWTVTWRMAAEAMVSEDLIHGREEAFA